jgi:capsular exopolysaccharide synthesis family protein
MSEFKQSSGDNSSSNMDESSFNFKKVIGKFLAFLPYFIFAVIISLIIAFMVNKYSNAEYLVRGSILIKEKGGTRGNYDGAENFVQGMQLLNASRNIENEQGILKSRALVEETVRNLDFGISYYSIGSLKTSDLYGDLPFVIILDSNHIQVNRKIIGLKFKDEKNLEVSIEKGGQLVIPKTGEIVRTIGENYKATFNSEDWIVSDFFKFKIQILDPKMIISKDVQFGFRLNPFESIVNSYYNRYSIKSINKLASLFEVSIVGEWPEKDKAFINQLFKSYIKTGLDDKIRVTQNTIRFIDGQLRSIGDTLNYVGDQLEGYRSANRIVDLSLTGKEIVESLSDLEQRKAEEDLRMKYYTYLETYISKSNPLDELVAPSSVGIIEPMLNSLLQKMVELYTKKKTLELTYRNENPEIIETNQTLEGLKSALLQNLKSIKVSSQIITQDLQKRIGKFEGQIGMLPQQEQQLLRMTRKFQLSDKLYTYLMEKRAEAGIAGAGINPDSKVIDNATIIEKTAPQTTNNYLIAVLVGILLPLLVLITLEFMNQDIQNHTHLQQLSKIPLVGTIVHNSKNTALVIANHPKSQVSESFRNLRTNINYLAGRADKKVIMVSSTVSGEGKTFISMNLSSVLAIGGYKTLLIGVDLRKPKIFQDFKLDNSFGLTNYLIGKMDKDSIIQKTELPNLSIVTAGPTPPNPSELIMSVAFYELLEAYKKEYDYIILDTPPIGLVADGLDILKHSDILLYVARQTVSKKNYLNLINELYANEKSKNIGLVFNDINFASVYGYGYGAYSYGYGYGYGNSYGYGYGYGYGNGYGGSYGEAEVEEKKSFWKRFLGM